MSQTLKVELGERSYPIHIGSEARGRLLEDVEALRQGGRPVAAVTDANVRECQGGLFDGLGAAVPVVVLEPGEKTKSLEHLGRVLDFLAAERIDRTGCVLAIGGGVIGDLGGFAAASYLRGVEFRQAPTSLLAMVDSSVGGKTGINLSAGKNMVGAFHQPQAVYVDLETLRTLPPREFSAGMAEIIKTGMLADEALFTQLAEAGRLDPSSDMLPGVIRRCCEIKAEVVRADETESAASGGRALLNLGHTFGHAIEAATGYVRYLHGEAVAIGLVLAAELSVRLGHLESRDVADVIELLSRYELPTSLAEPLNVNDLLNAMQRDKKVRAGKLRFVAMERIGRAVTVEDIPEDMIAELWSEAGAGRSAA